MFPIRPTTFGLAAVTCALLGIIAEGRAELAATSPFLPPQSQAIAAPVAPPPLELRGVTVMENSTMFSIFDPSKRSSAWVKLNEPGPGFSVKQYDPDNESVTVDYQGRTLNLVMKTPKIASSGPAFASVPVPTPMIIPTGNAIVQRLKAPAPPAVATTDAAKISEFTNEIQRRRDLRNQAGTTGPAPIPQNGPARAVTQPRLQVRPGGAPNAPGNSATRGGQ